MDSERTHLVEQLLEIMRDDKAYIKELEDEIRRLKKLPHKPQIAPNHKKKKEINPSDKRAGSYKEKKTKNLLIHETHVIKLDDKPTGSTFKGYRTFTVQDISIKAVNYLFKCERWQLIDGTYLQAQLPDPYRDQHFGPTLRAYILHQYYHQGVTQSLLHKQLQEWDIKISKGQLNNLLIGKKESYHKEKDAILSTGFYVSSYFQVDDTGARHCGKNGFCTYVGNDLFAYFNSTGSKSRLNFLTILLGDIKGYYLDEIALSYLKKQKPFSKKTILLLSTIKYNPLYFINQDQLMIWLNKFGIQSTTEIRLCLEAGLYSQLYRYRLKSEFFLLSDEAKQFSLPFIQHALCWLHVERKIKELLPATETQAIMIKEKRDQFWQLYRMLKEYKNNPSEIEKSLIKEQFDLFCEPLDNYILLNDALSRIKKWKEKLLLVLDYPFIPLNNNTSERYIREFVRKRKISGGTRHDEGRRCRDTFASLKKTCQKVEIKFWDYLIDRNYHYNKIKPVTYYIHAKAFKKQIHLNKATSTY